MKLNALYIFMCLSHFCFAQSDTSIVYLAEDAHETSKDSAYSLIKFYRQNSVWHGKEYYLKNSVLKSEGDYADKNTKIPIGNFNNYTGNGKRDFTASYNNGTPIEVIYYYKMEVKIMGYIRGQKSETAKRMGRIGKGNQKLYSNERGQL